MKLLGIFFFREAANLRLLSDAPLPQNTYGQRWRHLSEPAGAGAVGGDCRQRGGARLATQAARCQLSIYKVPVSSGIPFSACALVTFQADSSISPTLTPKDKDVVALQVTNSLLGGSFGSRITSNIRESKGYTYSPFSTIQNWKGVSVWYEQADITSEHTGDALQEISNEIKKLQTEAPPKEELEGIQRYMAGTFVLQNSNPGGIINQLNFLDTHGLDDSYLTNRVKNIYAVTPEKVSEITRDYFKYEDMTVVMVGDKKLLEKQIKKRDLQKK